MRQRTITAILALVLFLPFIIIGNLPFTIFVYIIATIGLLELIRMRKIDNYYTPMVIGTILLWLILIPDGSTILSIIGFSKFEFLMMSVLLLLAYTVLLKNKFTFDDAGFILLSTIYVAVGFYYLIETRNDVDGLWNVFFAFFIIWATDTGAYLIGRSFGKHKLWPQISPKKTIEGAIGGVVLASVVAVIFHFIHPFPHTTVTVIIVTIVASLFGQIGDLVESAFKRHYGVKDSGKLLPGHGGILDRFDSLLFVLPLLHFIQFL